jgi:HTH-type transcriptional regulator/antitoxin HigA
MTQLTIVDAYESFMLTASPYMHITDDQSDDDTITTLEQVLDCADDPLNPLINMLSNAIAKYETKDQALMAFVKGAQGLPADLALLRTLMAQHKLTRSLSENRASAEGKLV